MDCAGADKYGRKGSRMNNKVICNNIVWVTCELDRCRKESQDSKLTGWIGGGGRGWWWWEETFAILSCLRKMVNKISVTHNAGIREDKWQLSIASRGPLSPSRRLRVGICVTHLSRPATLFINFSHLTCSGNAGHEPYHNNRLECEI